VEAPARDEDAIFRAAGVLTLAAAALIGWSAFLPWLTSRTGGGPNAFQLGLNSGVSSFGAALVAASFALGVFGVVTIVRPWRPNVLMPFLPALGAGLYLANSWGQIFGGGYGPDTQRGSASIVCLLGLAFAGVATMFLLPTEHPSSS
jgi:hypothetical protein